MRSHSMDLDAYEACEHEGCNISEPRISMFLCKSCSKLFCHDHRLHAVHFCCSDWSESHSDDAHESSTQGISDSCRSSSDVGGSSVWNIMEAIKTRFSGEQSMENNSKIHFRAKTSINMSQMQGESEKEKEFWNKVEIQLASASNESKSEKSRALAEKTAHLLMKSKAMGDLTPPESRLHFIAVFPRTCCKSVIYLSRSTSIRYFLFT